MPNVVITINGSVRVTEGEYILKGISGEFYPCNEYIFHATYEEEKIDIGGFHGR